MYGFVTVWKSMDDGPYWVILLMYGSHDMRHTSFRRLTMVNGTPGFCGVTPTALHGHMDGILTQWAFHRVQEHPKRSSDEEVMTFRSWRSHMSS